jgi:macrolide-specific efflux system membrane fusion protein
MTASAQIITASANNVVSVPRSAVRTVDGQTVVTVVKDNAREDRPVTVGMRDSDLIEITSGLNVGDVVEVTQ